MPRARVIAPQCQRIEIIDREADRRHVRRAHRPPGKEQRTGFADPNLRPRSSACSPTWSVRHRRGCRVGHHRHPVLHQANALKLAMMGAIVRPSSRCSRCGAGPARRPADAQADPAAVAHVHRHRRRRGRRVPAVACDRRQLVRRRLHPRHGPRRRARRLHVELLPLVRQPRGPVRLVLQPAGADDPVSDASIWIRLPDLVARWCVGCCCPAKCCRAWARGGVQQAAVWAAGLVLLAAWMPFNNGLRPEGQIADRRADHLRADRAGDHLRPHDPGACDDRRRVHARHSADRVDRGGGAARRRPADAADPGARHRIVGHGRWWRRCWPRAPSS